jgi:hypothetical protein
MSDNDAKGEVFRLFASSLYPLAAHCFLISTAGAMNKIEFMTKYKVADPNATRDDILAAWVEYAEEKRLAREAEEKRLAREAEEKRLAREAEAEEKRLAREAEAEEKRLAREAEAEEKRLELAIEQEKTKQVRQGFGRSSLFLALLSCLPIELSVLLILSPALFNLPFASCIDCVPLPISLLILHLFVVFSGVSNGGGDRATTDAKGTFSACVII